MPPLTVPCDLSRNSDKGPEYECMGAISGGFSPLDRQRSGGCKREGVLVPSSKSHIVEFEEGLWYGHALRWLVVSGTYLEGPSGTLLGNPTRARGCTEFRGVSWRHKAATFSHKPPRPSLFGASRPFCTTHLTLLCLPPLLPRRRAAGFEVWTKSKAHLVCAGV